VAALANLLVSPLASIAGNELSLRHGRERVIWNTMLVSALLTLLLGFMSGMPWPLLAAMALLHMFAVMGDSASLTSGMVGASASHLRGASMAVHATLGFGAGFAGPLLFGVVLDASGGNADPTAWGWAFASLAVPALLGSFVLRRNAGTDAGV
jgi:MFS family permease